MPRATSSAEESSLSRAAHALQVLMAQQEAARGELQAVRREQEALVAEVAELKTRRAVLEAELAQAQQHAEQLRGLQGQAAAMIRGVREDADRELQQRRAELEALTEQIAVASKKLSDSREEAVGLQGQVAALRATLEVLGRERLALEAAGRQLLEEKAAAENQAQAARGAAEDMEKRWLGVQTALAEAQGLLEQMHGQMEALREEKRTLERSFRPLVPYRPPAQRIRLATVEVQVNSKLQQHDATALRLYAEQSGMEIKKIITEALRNYLSAEVYEVALQALEEEAKHGLEPHAEAAVERVPPEGAAAVKRRLGE